MGLKLTLKDLNCGTEQQEQKLERLVHKREIMDEIPPSASTVCGHKNFQAHSEEKVSGKNLLLSAWTEN